MHSIRLLAPIGREEILLVLPPRRRFFGRTHPPLCPPARGTPPALGPLSVSVRAPPLLSVCLSKMRNRCSPMYHYKVSLVSVSGWVFSVAVKCSWYYSLRSGLAAVASTRSRQLICDHDRVRRGYPVLICRVHDGSGVRNTRPYSERCSHLLRSSRSCGTAAPAGRIPRPSPTRTGSASNFKARSTYARPARPNAAFADRLRRTGAVP